MVSPVAGAIIGAASELFNRLVPDKNLQDKFRMEMTSKEFDAVIESNKRQASINEKEAEHANLFVAGWRPYIGWLCGIALTVGFVSKVIIPTLIAFLVFYPEVNKENILEFMRLIDSIDLEIYTSLLISLLGLTLARSWDKSKDIDTKSIKPNNWFSKK